MRLHGELVSHDFRSGHNGVQAGTAQKLWSSGNESDEERGGGGGGGGGGIGDMTDVLHAKPMQGIKSILFPVNE